MSEVCVCEREKHGGYTLAALREYDEVLWGRKTIMHCLWYYSEGGKSINNSHLSLSSVMER